MALSTIKHPDPQLLADPAEMGTSVLVNGRQTKEKIVIYVKTIFRFVAPVITNSQTQSEAYPHSDEISSGPSTATIVGEVFLALLLIGKLTL